MKPLFLIGNKRSGTTHLVRLLNLHPDVFVAHEADVIWILYQMAQGVPCRCYPWDGPFGMEATLKACADILEGETVSSGPAGVQEAFQRVLLRLMETGSEVQQPYAKGRLAWIGDKKPVQQADPEIMAFTRRHFPQARYLHIVRHPKSVVSSMVTGGRSWANVDFWKGTPEALLTRWAMHEEWVLEAKDSVPLHSLRYEDLCANPVEAMKKVFAFLELESPPAAAAVANAQTKRGKDRKHAAFELPRSGRAEAIMAKYGYTSEERTLG